MLTIPSITNGLTVTGIADYAFYYRYDMNSVTIPGTVVSIGYEAFCICGYLTNAMILNGVASIGPDAFSGTSLANVRIPESITNIGSNAFGGLSTLTAITVAPQNSFYSSVNGVLFDKSQSTLVQYPGELGGGYNIPAGVTNVWDYSFLYCQGLTNVTIPDSVIEIGEGAFESCTSLTSLNIPSSVAGIGDDAFNGCSALTNVTIADGVASIGNSAFMNCPGLISATMPGSVTNIGSGMFNRCSSLTAITVAAQNMFYLSVDGVLFDKSQDTLVEFPCSRGGNYSIPGSVINIGNEAFLGCTGLTNVTIPGSVIAIGDGAFEDCTSLSNAAIPSNVTSIGSNAFYNCPGLTGVTIPGGLTNIAAGVFAYTSLTNVTIPSGVTNIGDFAFLRCSRLTNVTTSGSPISIGDYAFDGTRLGSITIPSGVTSIGTEAFYLCPLTSLAIPSSVTNIGAGAFAFCRFLTNVSIPACVTSFRPVFPNSLRPMSVMIDNAVTNIAPEEFSRVTNLTSVTIGTNVTSIGADAFLFCISLTNATIPASVNTIGDSAFVLTSLINVAIPGSTTNIGDNAFEYCVILLSFYFKGNAPTAYPYLYIASNVPMIYYLPGTTGWDAFRVNSGLPTVLWDPQIQAGNVTFGVQNNQFGFDVSGPNNLTVVVAACTNLASPVWVPLTTNTLGSFHFTDPQWTNYPNRYYTLQMP